jgi:ribosome-associated heat shock protein Hsp15
MIRKGGTRLSDKIMLRQKQPGVFFQNDGAAPIASERQRIDRWLWHARVVRTRTDAAALASSGYVRVNGMRIDAPGRAVRLGDVITVALDRAVRVLKVKGFVERRGPSATADRLYEELQ